MGYGALVRHASVVLVVALLLGCSELPTNSPPVHLESDHPDPAAMDADVNADRDRGLADGDASRPPIPNIRPDDASMGVPVDMMSPPPDPEPDPDPDPGPDPDPDPDPDPAPEMLPPDPMVNTGWIGGPCERDQDCTYAEAFCLTEDEGYPRGMCSLGCDRICPDRGDLPVTFCVGEVIVGQGACVQRCDRGAFPQTGCRPGYVCRQSSRYNEQSRLQDVCLPGQAAPPPEVNDDTPCLAALRELGVEFDNAVSPDEAPAGHPEMRCRIEDAVLLRPPVAGVRYRYFTQDEQSPMLMSCELARSTHALSLVLRAYGIDEVVHMGTYNCRTFRGSDIVQLSEHGKGTALDLHAFVQDGGSTFNVEHDWEADYENPMTNAGRFFWNVVYEMWDERIFNIILTPNFNAAHHNHLHVDLTPGVRGVGL